MISRRYKIIFDSANCIMIYLLGLSVMLGAGALVRGNVSWPFVFVSAIVLAAFVAMRLFIQALPISIVAHAIVVAICWYLPFNSNAGNTASDIAPYVDKLLCVGFAALLMIIDINDFYKKKNQSYGVIHVGACALFIPVYAYIAYVVDAAEKAGDSATSGKYGVYSTVICLLCICFFALTLVRAYVANAIKLADNSQIDENAPVNYMYGNSNKFIGPIIALIIAIMLVVQSNTSANIFASMWMGLLGGVAGVCNLFSFVRSDSTSFIDGTQIAAVGSTLYFVEVAISAIILLAIIIAIVLIISKVYKSHWHKDVSSDETLESAAMVEKREWIYHKESRKIDDTSVTKGADITAEAEKEFAEKKETVEEKKETAAEDKAE